MANMLSWKLALKATIEPEEHIDIDICMKIKFMMSEKP